MADAPPPKRAKLVEQLVVPANEAITFKLIHGGRGAADASAAEFVPEMTHQVFGDDEEIKGHEQPQATVWVSSTTFQTAVEFHSSLEQPQATKVKQLLEDCFANGLLRDKTELMKAHATATQLNRVDLAKPLLQLAAPRQVSVYHFPLSETPDIAKALHGRMQQLLGFFIDGATPLDQSEPGWELFLAIMHHDGVDILVGFCTAYKLYAYPCNHRLRVSQIFVLPPFQHQGIGGLLLDAVYLLVDADHQQDVVYEEPTEYVQSMRERIELKRTAALPWLRDLAARQEASVVAMNGSAATQAPATLALSSDHVTRAQKELRFSKQQVRRIWEALLAQQPAFQEEPGIFALKGLVARRLFGGFADTKRQATGKQIFATNDIGSFIMHRVPSRVDRLRGIPVALEDKQDPGQSTEEREAALSEAVEHRMVLLSQLIASQRKH